MKPLAIPPVATVSFESIKPAGPARAIPIGHAKVAQQPDNLDFEAAAVWRIALSADYAGRDLMLRIRYIGDVARLYYGETLLDDNFFNGDAFEVGLFRFHSTIASQELLLKILPLRRDAPIYIQQASQVNFGGGDSVVELSGIDVVEFTEQLLTV